MKNSLVLQVEIRMYSPVLSAFEDAVQIASSLGCSVQFKFNGVICEVPPHGDVDIGMKKYLEAVSGGGRKYIIAK